MEATSFSFLNYKLPWLTTLAGCPMMLSVLQRSFIFFSDVLHIASTFLLALDRGDDQIHPVRLKTGQREHQKFHDAIRRVDRQISNGAIYHVVEQADPRDEKHHCKELKETVRGILIHIILVFGKINEKFCREQRNVCPVEKEHHETTETKKADDGCVRWKKLFDI